MGELQGQLSKNDSLSSKALERAAISVQELAFSKLHWLSKTSIRCRRDVLKDVPGSQSVQIVRMAASDAINVQ